MDGILGLYLMVWLNQYLVFDLSFEKIRVPFNIRVDQV